ncbi:MAG: aliphatic sulfonate ABC transporter substrate-binding protein [Lachnospiraceae bacterium]|nr:aliphatic sulfonate ABC transporter substrate-binding protein [Lachnospiraceae bacterium]
MRKFKKLLAAATIFTLILGLAGCGNNPDQAPEVHIGYFNNITHPQALLMKAEGSLEERYGDTATVTWTAFNAGPAEVEALFSGNIDIGYIGPVPAITANVKSSGDVQILSSASKGGAVLVKREGSDINSVSDLSGKIVAIPQIGNTQHLCLLNLLSENGLAPVTDGGTVTVAAVANADVANTMNNEDIDAALVPEPWGATLLANNAELLMDYDTIYYEGDYDVAVVVVRKEFMEEHPELVEQFLKEHEAATERINTEQSKCLQIINQELEDATGKSIDTAILTEAFTRIGVSSELNKASISRFADISLEQGFIDELPDDGLYVEN